MLLKCYFPQPPFPDSVDLSFSKKIKLHKCNLDSAKVRMSAIVFFGVLFGGGWGERCWELAAI